MVKTVLSLFDDALLPLSLLAGIAAAVLLYAVVAKGADPVPAAPCETPEECARRAKAAFAFAKAKQPGTLAASAPMPHEPSAKKSACDCGGACKCVAGECPKCDLKPAAKAEAPTASAFREVWYTDGYRTWRVIEPVGGTGAIVPSCPNGRCGLPR